VSGSGSLFYALAAEQARAAAAGYSGYLAEHIATATDATHGNLVNARGQALRIAPTQLFTGPGVVLRARAYSTVPLREFWQETPRLTLRQFERVWFGEHTATVYLSRKEFAERIGVRPDTLARYSLPEPDAYIGDTRGWTAATVDAWHASRPRAR
jgi:hypothetical protein